MVERNAPMLDFGSQMPEVMVQQTSLLSATITVNGVHDFNKALDKLEDKVQRQAARKTVQTLAKIVTASVRPHIPVYREKAKKGQKQGKQRIKKYVSSDGYKIVSGNLKRSLFALHTWKSRNRSHYAERGTIGTKITFRRPQGSHANVVEAGHDKVLWGEKVGGRVEGKWFFKHAIARARNKAARTMNREFGRGWSKAIKQSAARGKPKKGKTVWRQLRLFS